MTEEPKCRDCKWLTGKKNIRGIECMNPKNQEKWNKAKTLWMGELRKDTARYKQRNAPACKKFEAKESEHMGRYIDEDALEDKAKQYSLGYYEEDEWAVPLYEIAEAPSIDIVRCKECKHWYRAIDESGTIERFNFSECTKGHYGNGLEFYCADGERREP